MFVWEHGYQYIKKSNGLKLLRKIGSLLQYEKLYVWARFNI